jgi:hypothetical protein
MRASVETFTVILPYPDSPPGNEEFTKETSR